MKVYLVVHGCEGEGYVNVAARFSRWDAEQILQEKAHEYGYHVVASDEAIDVEDGRWYLDVDEVDVS